jgi:predicted metal-binding membrane protein
MAKSPPATGEVRTPFRQIALPWAVLATLGGLAWLATIAQARNMGTGPGTMGMSLPFFLGMWIVMMAAMMFPSVAPVAASWARSIRRTATGAGRAGRISAFVGGYLVAWGGFGVVAFGLFAGTERLVDAHPGGGRWLGAAVFGVAGLYQLTPLKEACLRHCRSPFAQLARYAGYRGTTRDLRVGLHHGLYCVGCCWGLMIVLVALGVMNVAAMAGLAAVIFLEKLWRRGQWLSRLVGVGFLAAAVLAPSQSWLLPALRSMPGMRHMHMESWSAAGQPGPVQSKGMCLLERPAHSQVKL